MRSLLALAFGVTLPATIMFDYPTVESLAEYLGREVLRIEPWVGAEDRPRAAPSGDGDALSSIEQMSDDEVERVLTERLTSGASVE